MSAQIQPESIDFTNKKDPQEGQFLNGGNYVAGIEQIIKTVQQLLQNKTNHNVIYIC